MHCTWKYHLIVKEDKISVLFIDSGCTWISVIFVFADSIFHSFGRPLTFGVSTVPEMEKEQQKDAPITHNDVQKDWKLVLAILHEKELAYVDGDNNELDLMDERMKNIIQIWRVTKEQLFNAFFATYV